MITNNGDSYWSLMIPTEFGFVSCCTTFCLLIFVYLFSNAIYCITLHPLSSFPGPTSAAVSRLPWWRSCITGDQVAWIQKLHEKYGPVVRISPNELSYVDQGIDAWQEIYGHKKGKEEWAKAPEWFLTPRNGIRSIVSTEYDAHRRFRRIFAAAFSDRAVKKQESIFHQHIDHMMARLEEAAVQGKPIDLVQIFNYMTFDIMGDLCFGQPLGMLENDSYSPWVESVFASVKVIPLIQIIQYYPLLENMFNWFEPKAISNMRNDHFQYTADRVDLRLTKGSDKPDIWNLAVVAGSKERLSVDEMHSNAEFFMLAGSETTATHLSGFMYQLFRNPDKTKRLMEEIRSAVTGDEDLDMERIADLKYLNACIQEAFRIYPSIPIGVPRVVPKGGRPILGKWVAENTRVSVHHYSTYHSSLNFIDPDVFLPERWLLEDERFANDHREAVQPFMFGPRDCLGIKVAMHELRLVVAKLLYKFDLAELCEESRDWTNQKVYTLWDKPPLMCQLRLANPLEVKEAGAVQG